MEDKPDKEYSVNEPQEVPNAYEELEEDRRIDDDLDDEDFEPERKPAVIINVQSWAIPIVGLVMLLIGITAGYAGRAIIAQLTSGTNTAAVVTEAPSAVSTDASDSATAGQAGQLPSTTPQQPSPEQQAELMAFLVSQTKHFVGEADAPVTIIEFSDFQ
jgi:hypothetical protein